MASSTVYDQIKQALALALAPVEVVDIEDSSTRISQGDQPFVALEDLGGSEDMLTIGAPQALLAEGGSLAVHVYTPSTDVDGLKPARLIVDAMRERMRYRTLSVGPDVLRVTGISPASPIAYEGGRFHEAISFLAYDLDFIRTI